MSSTSTPSTERAQDCTGGCHSDAACLVASNVRDAGEPGGCVRECA